MLYPVNEIFYSIQGEGFHTGKPAVFIRLAGCNLKCPWCDTDHSKKMEMTESEIVDEVERIGDEPCFVIITGGEPTIHNLEPLLKKLETETSAMIAIETNGTNPQILGGLKELGLVDWITLSPKKLDDVPLQMVRLSNEIKIVFEGEEKTKDIETRLELCQSGHQNRLYIQPCSEDFQPAVDFVLKNPQWRLSVQIQKVIGVK